MLKEEALSFENLHKLLEYRPGEGFFWKVNRGRLCKKGQRAGNIRKDKKSDYIQYRELTICGYKVKEHRLVWLFETGYWPVNQIDHINGNGLDNRIENLRDVPGTINQRNARMRPDNKTGVVGVHVMRSGKYRASIQINGKKMHIGCYDTLEEAAKARRDVEERNGYSRRNRITIFNQLEGL